MKKRVVFLIVVLCAVLNVRGVFAKSFKETIDDNNYYFISREDGEIYKYFNLIFDENKNAYFNVTPHIPFMPRQNYSEKPNTLSEELLKDFSRIIYFGYGYNGNFSENYYYATQYLIFERAMREGYQIEVVDSLKNFSDNRLEETLVEIRKNMQKHLSFTNKTITEKKIVIDEKYILDNFNVSSDTAKVSLYEDKIEVELLDGVLDSTLYFTPKNICTDIKVWIDSWGTNLLHMDTVCEEEYSIVLRYEAPKVEEPKKEESIEPPIQVSNANASNKEEIVEVREFEVPSTSKYSLSWFFILLFLGNVYYVFKK